MSNFLSIYSSHDASICITDEKQYRVFELERYTKVRFDRFNGKSNKKLYQELYHILKEETGISEVETCYVHNAESQDKELISQLWNVNDFQFVGHHISHAASSFYQSDFKDALIISYDGGGYEGEEDPDNRVTYFNAYLGSRESGISRIYTSQLNLGTCYGMLAIPVSEINKNRDNWEERFLGFSGKIMGLAAYGKIRSEWISSLEEYYREPKKLRPAEDLAKLSSKLKLSLDFNALSGEDSYDLAATSQYVFEKVAWEEMKHLLEAYPELPICLAGGCALNILYNQILHDKLDRPLFVPPNPSDCGLSFGMVAFHTRPQQAVDLTYAGFPILDLDMLDHVVSVSPPSRVIQISSPQDLVPYLENGKIIGIMRGNSEHGPRALGNRSILCNPAIKDMKNILNSKVKFREWFRPFAPMVQDTQVNEYFEFTGESKFMSYSPRVRDKYQELMPAIVHEDKTSRVQTVSEKDNKFIFDLLEGFKQKTEIGVLLNTSFNIKGRPILTTIDDALEVLHKTELDMVLIENYLFTK